MNHLTRFGGITTGLMLTAAALSGCASATVAATSTSTASEHEHQHEGHDDRSPALPVWDAAARIAALEAAESTLTAFLEPTADAAAWISALAPHLTATATTAYSSVDPANIPPASITGQGTLVDESSTYLAVVELPTTAGTYTVLLQRDGATSPWLAEQLTFPGGS